MKRTYATAVASLIVTSSLAFAGGPVSALAVAAPSRAELRVAEDAQPAHAAPVTARPLDRATIDDMAARAGRILRSTTKASTAPAESAVRAEAVEEPVVTPPQILAPVDGATVAGTFQVSVAPGTGTNVTLWVDGAVYASVPVGESPALVSVSVDGSATGIAHTVEVGECASGSCPTSADGTVTDTITVRAFPAGSVDITGATYGAFSPNGDGNRETNKVSYTTAAPGAVTVNVVRVSGSSVVRTVAYGTLAAGSRTFVWNGKNDAGTVVADGTYRVDVHLVTDGGSAVKDSITLRVDTKAPTLTGITSSNRVVFPRKDGYFDSVKLRATLGETVPVVQVRIINSAGRTVRTFTEKSAAAGTQFIWDGRRSAGGSMLPAGTYAYVWYTRDAVGNARTTGKFVTKIDARILAKKTRTTTLTPAASKHHFWIGDCSRVAGSPNGWSGAHGYYSMWNEIHGNGCPGTEDQDWVEGVYEYTLPSAIKYGTVKIGATGKSHAYTSTAVLGLLRNNEDDWIAAERLLQPAYGTYWTAAKSVAPLGYGRTVYWFAGTGNYGHYDLRSFKVTWQYYVLVK